MPKSFGHNFGTYRVGRVERGDGGGERVGEGKKRGGGGRSAGVNVVQLTFQ